MFKLAEEVIAALQESQQAEGPAIADARNAIDHAEPESAILIAIGEAIEKRIPIPAALIERIRAEHDADAPVVGHLEDVVVKHLDRAA